MAALLLLASSPALAQQPAPAAEYLKRGYDYYKGGDYSRAIAELTEAIRIEPDRASAWLTRGNAYRATNDYLHALADYSEAIRLRPGSAVAWNNRGEIWFRVGDYGRAIADVSEAIRLRADDKLALYNRAVCYRLKGDRERALADLRRVLALDGNHAGAKLELERLEATARAVTSAPDQQQADKISGQAQGGAVPAGPQRSLAESTGGTKAPSNEASEGETRNAVADPPSFDLGESVNDETPPGPANDRAKASEQKSERAAAPRRETAASGEAARGTMETGTPSALTEAPGDGLKKTAVADTSLTDPAPSLHSAKTRAAVTRPRVRQATGKGHRSLRPASVAVGKTFRDRGKPSPTLIPVTLSLDSHRPAQPAPTRPAATGAAQPTDSRNPATHHLTFADQSGITPGRSSAATLAIVGAILIGSVLMFLHLFRRGPRRRA